MRLVRVGTAAISVKVGDFNWNAGRLRAVIEAAREQGVHLLVTPELGISGYSLEDRISWTDIARQSWANLVEIAECCKDMAAFVGLPVRIGALTYNAAALIAAGRVQGLILKKHLPMYSIFYESRNYTKWGGGAIRINGVPAGDLVFDLPFGMVSAEICEDLWSPTSPAGERVPNTTSWPSSENPLPIAMPTTPLPRIATVLLMPCSFSVANGVQYGRLDYL